MEFGFVNEIAHFATGFGFRSGLGVGYVLGRGAAGLSRDSGFFFFFLFFYFFFWGGGGMGCVVCQSCEIGACTPILMTEIERE